MRGLGTLELRRTRPWPPRLTGEHERGTRWVSTGSEPQGGKRGCCSTRKQPAPTGLGSVQRPARSATGLAVEHRTVSLLQPGFQRAVLKAPCSIPRQWDRSHLIVHWYPILGKHGQCCQSLLPDFYACAPNTQRRPSTGASPKRTRYFPLSLRGRGGTGGFAERALGGGKLADHLNRHW